MTAPWHIIKDQLIADSAMTEQHITRTPKPRHCRDCKRAVIAAITDLGFETTVEPNPTTPAGELTTLINGGQTFALLDHGEMVWRDQRRIKYRDANNERAHAKHQCNKAPPENNPLYVKRNTRITDYDAPPPF